MVGHAVESILIALHTAGLKIAARTLRAWCAPAGLANGLAARTVSDALVEDAVRSLVFTTNAAGQRVLAPEGLYGRRKMLALIRRTALPHAGSGPSTGHAFARPGQRRVREETQNYRLQPGRYSGGGPVEQGLHRTRPGPGAAVSDARTSAVTAAMSAARASSRRVFSARAWSCRQAKHRAHPAGVPGPGGAGRPGRGPAGAVSVLAFAALQTVEAALPEYHSSALGRLGRTEEAEAEASRAFKTEQGRRWFQHNLHGADAVAAATKAADAARERAAEYLLAARLEQLREQAAARIEQAAAAAWTDRLPELAARPLDGDATGPVIA